MSRVSVQLRQDGMWHPVAHSGLRFKRTAPGGMTEASFQITSPGPMRDHLRTDAQVHITSTATTGVLWTGRVQAPRGEVTCDGDAALLATSNARRPYIVQDLSVWERDDRHPSLQAATTTVTTVDVNPPYPALVLQFPEGTKIAPSGASRIRMRTYAYDGTGYQVGAFRAKHAEAVDSDRWQTYGVMGLDNGQVSGRLWQAPMSDDPGDGTWSRGTSSAFAQPSTLCTIGYETSQWLDYSTADDRRWAAFPHLTTAAQLRRRDGSDVNPMPQRVTLTAHEIIEDLLGRDLLGVVSPADVDTVVNEGAQDHLDSLYYADLVPPVTILNDLVAHTLGDYYYAIWPGTSGDGRPGLWWMPWPTQPRWQLPPGRTDVKVTGSDEGLCNRVRCIYMDQYGRKREVVVTGTPVEYPDLADLGYWDEGTGWRRIVEAKPVDLGDKRTSTAAATQYAKAWLRQCATRPRAGTAVVGVGDCMDLFTGQVAAPEEIMPGYLAWSPELGESLRVTATEYDDDTQTCTLQLDQPRSTVDQLIARALRRNR
ncbi:hypothetical protein IEE94_11225 [Yimella sp. cx-573]|nr:hypothetical protein [Yimella sp. cx-573]